jgi:hypothetical protein
MMVSALAMASRYELPTNCRRAGSLAQGGQEHIIGGPGAHHKGVQEPITRGSGAHYRGVGSTL